LYFQQQQTHEAHSDMHTASWEAADSAESWQSTIQ